MSLQSAPLGDVPFGKGPHPRVPPFRKGRPYLHVRDDLGLFSTDARFAALFPR